MNDSFAKRYEGFGWIKVGRRRDDPLRGWEERYRILEAHHLEETEFLIAEIRRLAEECDRRLQSMQPF